ncbi:MAG: NAD-dependent epimerase/dehydratase family protein [Chitinophagaceae bacterium]|nr:NAD-dependent epimerase/dehydratase family protein [Chitinophagaceae bacterium]
MQTILGAGGAVGKPLAKELLKYDSQIRLASRNPQKINETDELISGNLTDKSFVEKTVEGSDVVYLTAGLDYKYKVWKSQWPVIMQHAIDACKKYHSKLVFFDNAYMYDPHHMENLTEETPVKPVSRKGKVRAGIADNLLKEIRAGNLTGMIVRASDFYGPGVKTSVMLETVFKRMKAGKKPLWMGNPNAYHSMTNTPDAAKATAMLGNTPDAYQQIWHLPTENKKLTGKQWIELFTKEMGRSAKFNSLSGSKIRFIGLFVPFFRELGEMMYQLDNNYFFSSSKFEKYFPDFKITSPETGVKEVVNADK